MQDTSHQKNVSNVREKHQDGSSGENAVSVIFEINLAVAQTFFF